MILQGKPYVDRDRVLKLLKIENKNHLYQEPYKSFFKGHTYKPIKSIMYYSQERLYEFLDIERVRYIFHCALQSLVMLILDEVNESEVKIANNLGFTHPQVLRTWLESKKSSKDAMILVKACKHYRPIVALYDREYL